MAFDDENRKTATAATDSTGTPKLSPPNIWTSSNEQPLEQLKPKLDDQRKTIEPSSELKPVEPFPFAGYLATLLASFLFANAGLCVKLLPVEASIREKTKACMIRAMFMVLFSAIGISYKGLSFRMPRDELLINFLRSLLASIGMMSNYIALNYISIGESTAIIYSAPIWTSLLSFLILKEPLKFSMLLALPASLLAIALLGKPDLLLDANKWWTSDLQPARVDLTHGHTMESNSTNSTGGRRQGTELLEQAELEHYDESRLPGILAALTCSLVTAFMIIVLKYRKKTPIETCSFYLGLTLVLLCLVVQSIIGFGSMPSSPSECFIHFYIGTISYLVQLLFQWALQFVPAGIHLVTRSLDVAFGFLMGAVFLQELVPWTSLVGSTLTISVVVVLVLEEHFARAAKRLLSLTRRRNTSSCELQD